jgi:hypothetical protein
MLKKHCEWTSFNQISYKFMKLVDSLVFTSEYLIFGMFFNTSKKNPGKYRDS